MPLNCLSTARNLLGLFGLLSFTLLLWFQYKGSRAPTISEEALLTDPSAEIQMGEEWMALSFRGTQVGLIQLSKSAREGGYRFEQRSVLRLKALGDDLRVEVNLGADLDLSFQVKRFDFSAQADSTELRGEGQIDATGLRLLIHTGDQEIHRHLPLSAPPVLRSNLGPLLSRGDLSPGALFKASLFDPLSQQGQALKVKVIGPTRLQIMGQELSVVQLRSELAGVKLNAWINQRGEILRQELGMGVTAERVSRTEARWGLALARRSGGADLMEATMIPVAGLPPHMDGRPLLRLRLSGADLSAFELEDRRQHWNGEFLEIRREPLGEGLLLPVEPSEAPPGSLEASALIQSQHPDIRAAALAAAAGAQESLSAARRLMEWVDESLEEEMVVGVPSALEVLKNRQGDCTEHAALFLALARSLGIPARLNLGLVYQKGRFGYHAWNEVLGSEGWVSVDPSWGQMPVDRGHIRLLSEGLKRQPELLQVMGQLQIHLEPQ